ncbi:gluconokinase [Solicola sp. PLA-1-18]|uniref:gluconokinase n=1 Tax=Solicola sp. PLA-1-18 TaxID=3380532 RepID=UPI003B814273
MTRITPAPLVVVMGISGTGKTTVGELVAQRLGLEYSDADVFHPQANIDKMSAGTPLTDEDRWPWLEAIGAWLAERDATGGVVSCSALRRAYRDVLTGAAPRARFLHLDGDIELIRERVAHRSGHFMPVSLLESQKDTLVPLGDDEPGLRVDVADSPDQIADAFLADLEQHASTHTEGA